MSISSVQNSSVCRVCEFVVVVNGTFQNRFGEQNTRTSKITPPALTGLATKIWHRKKIDEKIRRRKGFSTAFPAIAFLIEQLIQGKRELRCAEKNTGRSVDPSPSPDSSARRQSSESGSGRLRDINSVLRVPTTVTVEEMESHDVHSVLNMIDQQEKEAEQQDQLLAQRSAQLLQSLNAPDGEHRFSYAPLPSPPSLSPTRS